MKHKILTLAVCLFAASILGGCSKKPETMNCKIYWQLYHHPKHVTESDIETAFQETFFGFYEKVNDNTVMARNTTRSDVRSLTLKLATMADAKIKEPVDPDLHKSIEVRVFIDFGTYVEEVWSKDYL